MEALTQEFAARANELRRVPPASSGYLAQNDLRALIGDALSLGWTLYAYEADLPALRTAGTDLKSMASVNRREATQAANFAGLLAQGHPTLVWCGNGHLTKIAVTEWRPMGFALLEDHAVDAWAIDQTATVHWPDRGPLVPVGRFEEELIQRGGVAGFLSEEGPEGWPSPTADAFILALDNNMT